jgi:hypothetical protein
LSPPHHADACWAAKTPAPAITAIDPSLSVIFIEKVLLVGVFDIFM